MKVTTRIRKMRVLCVIAALAMVLSVLSAATAAAFGADNLLKIEVRQVFKTTSDTAGKTFAYRLRPLEEGCPMPPGSAADGYSFTIAGNGRKALGPLDFGQPGIYRYELSQAVAAEKPGYTYDRRVYRIEVYMGSTKGASVIVSNTDGTKAGGIEFVNGYKAKPSDPKLMVDPPVRKAVSGSPWYKGTFTFRLVAKYESQPMPEGSAKGVKTLTIIGPGEGEFGTWGYDREGVYYYTVHEVDAHENGYAYDRSVYTIVDTVTDKSGQLVLSRIVTNQTNRYATSLDFVNKYTSGGDGNGGGGGGGSGGNGGNGVYGGGGKGAPPPRTWDSMDVRLHRILLTASGSLAVSVALLLLMGRNGRRDRKAR